MESPGRCGDWLAPPPLPLRAHTPSRHDRKGGDFYLATSEDLYLATSGDFFMATDSECRSGGDRPWRSAVRVALMIWTRAVIGGWTYGRRHLQGISA